MSKIKLTKNELKKQKESLQRYTRFLPTLQLKKRQLQFELVKIKQAEEDTEREVKSFNEELNLWIDVFAEDAGLRNMFKAEKVISKEGNIAGVDIPVLERVEFKKCEYDFMRTPVWIDRGLEALKKTTLLWIQLSFIKKQKEILEEELRVTSQRVNLFEKVKVPEAKENIRVIRIYLGDSQTAEVVRGKIAKKKINRSAKFSLV